MKSEIIVSLILLVVLGIILNPTNLLMPETVLLMLLLGLIVGFLGFVGFIWQEGVSDERETTHAWKAGRFSFLAGLLVLVLGIVVQALQHDIDPWLLYTLLAMVATKLISRIVQKIRDQM